MYIKLGVKEGCFGVIIYYYTERFITFSVIINIYNKKTKGLTLMEFFNTNASTDVDACVTRT